jgi:hypothetical protein
VKEREKKQGFIPKRKREFEKLPEVFREWKASLRSAAPL